MELYTISGYSLRLDCFLCCVLAKLANEQTPILVALAAKYSSRELFETIWNMQNVLEHDKKKRERETQREITKHMQGLIFSQSNI